jgi:putative hydrolase of the HAD superfamily
MNAYDHLFFDLDNTLWDFKTNSRAAMLQTMIQTSLLQKLGDFDTFFEEYEKINSQLWIDYHLRKVSKQKLIYERFSKTFDLFNITISDPVQMNELYLENMAVQKNLFEGTVETLDYLNEKGYKMSIISNGFREVQYKKLKNCGLEKYFAKVFISEETKSIKPEREIFEFALKSTNSKKSRSIMIGDSWEIDIKGAMNFGIDQVFVGDCNSQQLPTDVLSLKLASNTRFISLKPPIKTFFADRLNKLIKLL